MTVERIVTETLLANPGDIPRKKWKTRELELVDLIGLSPHHAPRYPHQFSSGQLQRIATARSHLPA